jgi:prepilin-type N-terminal cleavage/methylation domain-containing protein
LHFDAGMRCESRQRGSGGFTLVEVLVALALLTIVSIGVVWLFTIAIDAGRTARERTMAAPLASAKLEQLRSLEWRAEVSATGTTSRSDLTSNISVEPVASGGPGLSESPPGTLDSSLPPYVDYLDRFGRWVGSGASPPAGAVYIRRWAVHPLAGDPDRTLALQVLVTTVARERARLPPAPHAWGGEDVLLATMITRRAR